MEPGVKFEPKLGAIKALWWLKLEPDLDPAAKT